jgi:hypothetical protein
MSVSLLKVYRGEKRYGTLEIHAQVWPDGNVNFGWEWVGGPEGTDGRPFDWVKDGDFVELKLTSHDTGMTGVLNSAQWYQGPVPPQASWFKHAPIDIFIRGLITRSIIQAPRLAIWSCSGENFSRR